MNIQDFGKYRANINATSTNSFKAVDPDAVDATMDYFNGAVSGSATLTSFTVTKGGVSTTTAFTGSYTAATASQAVQEIAAVLVGSTIGEVDPVITLEHDGTDLTFFHIGNSTLTNIITSAGTHATTEYDEVITEVALAASDSGTITDLGDGTSTDALTDGTYPFTVGDSAANLTQAATLKGDIETSMGNLSAYFRKVEVTPNDTDSDFDVVIYVEAGQRVLLDTNEFSEVSRKAWFKLA